MWDAEAVALIAGAYFLGAVPSAYLVIRWRSGVDLRRYGSGNLGISNVYRQGGFWLSLPVVLFDVIVKGSVPVIIASSKGLDLGLAVEVSAAFAAIMGHSWSVFMRFRGGRGMATALGALITLSWPLPFLFGLPAFIGWILKGDPALWWGVAILTLPAWTLILRLDTEVTYFTLVFIAALAMKRLLSNRPFGQIAVRERIPRRRLIFNRLVYDRDISNRQEWTSRIPD